MYSHSLHFFRLGFCCLILLGFLACSKQQEEVPEHELTEQELKKQHLDESFSALVDMVELEEGEEVKEYIVKHSVVSLGLDASVIYNLRQGSQSLVWLKFRYRGQGIWLVDGDLYGGIELHGSLNASEMSADYPDQWDKHWDIHVYDNGEDVAKLGLEVYDLGMIPVFRFPDGTSYSLSTLVLIEPLIDYLLEHVLSME